MKEGGKEAKEPSFSRLPPQKNRPHPLLNLYEGGREGREEREGKEGEEEKRIEGRKEGWKDGWKER